MTGVNRGRRGFPATAVVAVAVALVASLASPAIAASEAADGFYVEVVHAGFSDFQLTDFAYVDETHVLATGKSGAVRFVPLDDPSAGREIARFDVHDDTDLGLVGIALANDYATSGRVYLSSNHLDGTGAFGRLSVHTVDDPSAPTTLDGGTVLLDRIRTDAPIHSVGGIVVRSDDTVLLAVGDGRPNSSSSPKTLRTYDPDHPQGKILRINPDGSGVADNPWYDASAPDAWRSRAYAVGLRNPFRFTTLPGDEDVLVIGNVGSTGDESLVVGGSGNNYGWPCREGRRPTPGYEDLEACQELEAQEPYPFTPPTWAYDRSLPPGGGVSITGGTFPTSPEYPAGFRGDYLFGDYARQLVWTARFDGSGAMTQVPEAGPDGTGSGAFARDLGAPVTFRTSPSGLASWADILTGEIVRLRWTPGNRPPLVRGSASLDETTTVRFSSEGTYDLDGDPLSFRWDFGDGTRSRQASPTHTYPAEQAYTATLTVADGRGASEVIELAIPLDDAPPRLRDVRTPGGGPFRVGDPLAFSARAVDPEEGELTDRIEWLARLEHCPPGGGCHYHGGAVGRGGSFSMAFPDHGDDTSVEVRLSVTDGAGRTVERTFRAEPRLVRVAPASEPDGVRVRLNGRGDGHEVVVGSSNLLVAPEPVGPVRWDGWDDGVRAFEREVIAPEQDTAWTAHYAIRARRVAGPDRVGTAVAVSRRMWDRADTVVLARTDDPADALAATPLAGRLQAPVLLTATDGLDPRVEEELERLAPSRIVLVGGPRALGPAIVEGAAAVASSVERLAGPDRFATSVAVADRLGADRAFLVRGDAKPDGSPSWADALAAGPVAARQDRAVLLAAHGMVPGPVADHLGGLRAVTLVGGPAALTEDVEAAVREEVPATDRVGGADRYETAQRLDALAPTPEPAGMWLTTGFDWPDALAAGAAAASYGERLLLLAGDPAVTTGLFEGGRLAEVSRIRVAGGPAAVPTTVWRELLEQVEAALPDLLDR